jgi:hypothetical protein
MTMNMPVKGTLFRPDGVVMLADVRAQVDLLLDGNTRRDTISAFNVLQARAGIDLGATPATARAVRELFDALRASSVGVSAKRHANIRSLVFRAVERFGMKRTRLTARVPLTPGWAALLDRVENKAYLQGIKRLAHYGSALGISPEAIRSEHLVGLHDALEQECMTKHPRKVIKHTIAMWNAFGRTVPGWPAAILASPLGASMIQIDHGIHEHPVATGGAVVGWQSSDTGAVGSPNAYATTDRPLAPDHKLGAQMKITRKALKASGAAIEAAIGATWPAQSAAKWIG